MRLIHAPLIHLRRYELMEGYEMPRRLPRLETISSNVERHVDLDILRNFSITPNGEGGSRTQGFVEDSSNNGWFENCGSFYAFWEVLPVLRTRWLAL